MTVRVAASGVDAIEMFTQHHDTIDGVLLDVRMPDPDGPHVLAALRNVDPQVKCCFMTGDTGEYTVEQLVQFGAACVLSKPFSVSQVAQTLRGLVVR